MKSDIIDIEVQIKHRTDRAVLVETDRTAEPTWLPLSVIEIDPVARYGLHTVTLPERVAADRGLI